MDKPGLLMKHIRTKHKEVHNQAVQCWRMYVQTDGHANYDKSTFDEGHHQLSQGNTPSTPSTSQPMQQPQQQSQDLSQKAKQPGSADKQGTQQPSTPSLPYGLEQAAAGTAIAIEANQEHAARQAGKRHRGENGRLRRVLRQRIFPAAGPGPPAVGPAVAIAEPQPASAAPPLASTAPEPASTAPPLASTVPQRATTAPQPANAEEPGGRAQAASKDRLEMLRMTLAFAEKVIAQV